jgi:secreted Zn-dependent insulinase-like peptidase
MIKSIGYKVIGIVALTLVSAVNATPVAKKDLTTKVIQLDNHAQVMIISDPNTRWAAMSLTLPVGQRDDPSNAPGLFHALEHATFLGSKKYPKGGFRKFVKSHQGWMNASTRTDNTRYHFQVKAEALKEGASRLSDLIFNPILSNASIKAAVVEVDEEFKASKDRDWLKVLSVIQENINPQHPASKFGKGNQSSLSMKPTVLNELITNYHQRYYQPNDMALAIYGPQSIEELTTIVKDNFSLPARKANDIPMKEVALFLPEQLGKLIAVDTKQSSASLDIRFQVPAQTNNVNTQRYAYMQTLFESRGNGSLLHHLIEQELASDLLIYSQGNSHYGLFDVYIDLTDKGRARKDDVLAMLFQYIDFLAATSHPQHLQNELQTLELIDNASLISMDAGDWLSDITDDMQRYKQANWLNKSHWKKSLTPDEINDYLTHFTRDKAEVIFSRNENLESPKVSAYYGANYQINNVSYSQGQTMKNKRYAFPKMNPFLTSFEPHYFDTTETSEVIFDDKQCIKVTANSKSNKGSAEVFVAINTQVSGEGAHNLALLHILSSYLASPNTLNAEQAAYAGYTSSSSLTDNGLRLVLSGRFDHFESFLDVVIAERYLTKPTAEGFKALKMRAYTSYEDLVSSSDYKQTYRNLKGYLAGYSKENTDLLVEINKVSYAQFIDFLASSLSTEYTDIQVLSAVPTNIVKNKYLPYFMKLNRHCHGIEKKTVSPLKSYQGKRSQVLAVVTPEALTLGWVEHDATIKIRAIQHVLKNMIAQSFYQEMRINKQLAYHVSTNFINKKNSALAFTVQSSKVSSEVLVSMIDEFMQEQLSDMRVLTQALIRVKKSLQNDMDIRPSGLATEIVWLSNINQLGYQPEQFVELYLQQVNALTIGDIKHYVDNQLSAKKSFIKL